MDWKISSRWTRIDRPMDVPSSSILWANSARGTFQPDTSAAIIMVK